MVMAKKKKQLSEEKAVIEEKTEAAEESVEAAEKITEATEPDEESVEAVDDTTEVTEEPTEATEENTESAEDDMADEKEEAASDSAESEEKTKPKRKGIVIGVCLVLAAVAVGAVAVVSGLGSGEKAPAETVVPQTQTTEQYETIPAAAVQQAKLEKVVYSSQVGQVNGKLYAVVGIGSEQYEGYYRKAADKPVIPALPVETEGYITSFAQCGDHVYYVVTESYKRQSTYTLYRCKVDFTESEQLLQSSYTTEGPVGVCGTFVIDNGKLFSTPVVSGEGEPRQYKCVDLKTKEVTDIIPADYNKVFGAEGEQKIDIFNGKVLLSQAAWGKGDKTIAYVMDGNKKIPLTDEAITDEFCGKNIVGYAADCVYYTEIFNAPINGANGKLKSYNLTTGEIKTLDQRLIGGTSDYFQNYEEIAE